MPTSFRNRTLFSVAQAPSKIKMLQEILPKQNDIFFKEQLLFFEVVSFFYTFQPTLPTKIKNNNKRKENSSRLKKKPTDCQPT